MMKTAPVMAILMIMLAGLAGASAVTTNHATVIIQFGNGQTMEYTVSFSEKSISAMDATIYACQNLSLYLNYSVSSYGAFVNQIGWEKNDFSGTGMWWHLMVWKNNSRGWMSSSVGASNLLLKNGGIVSWVYTMDNSSWVPYGRPHVAPGYLHAWTSPRGNFNNTGVSYGKITGDDILWHFSGQSSWGFSSTPVVSEGRIFIADSSALYALTMSGSELWNNTLGAAGYYGMASPVVFGNYVIIYSSNNTIRAFYQENGTVAWTTQITGDAVSSPALGFYNHTPVLFYATFVMNNTGKLYAINAENGSVIWSRALMGSNYYGAPAILNEEVIIPVAGIEDTSYQWHAPFGVQAIAFNGTYLWNYTSEYSVRSPVVVANSHIYFVSTGTSGNLVALNYNGTVAWKLNIGSATAPIAVHGSTIFAGNDSGYIMAVQDNGNSATLLWSHKLNGAVKAGLIYASGKVVGVTDTSNSEVYCFYENGTQAWNASLGSGGYVISSPVVVGSYLLLATNSGYLYAFADNSTLPSIGTIHASNAMVGQPIVVTVDSQEYASAVLYYRNLSDGQWHAVWMYYSSGEYVGVIPAQSTAGTVDYYVVLTDDNGTSSTSPTSQAVVSSAVPELSWLPVLFIFGMLLMRRRH